MTTTIRDLIEAELDNYFDELHDRALDRYAARQLPLKPALMTLHMTTHDFNCTEHGQASEVDADTLLSELPCCAPADAIIAALLPE
jgi:hypothetical protein